MKKVYFATGNKRKYKSWKKTFRKYGIKFIYGKFKFEKELDSNDLAEIASDKVMGAYKKFKAPVFSVDAGFYIRALDGFPGPKVNPALKKPGIEGILEMLKGKPRECEFNQCLAYLELGMEKPKIFYATTPGRISEEPIGSMKSYLWSELGLIFIPKGESKTLAEMTKKEWLAWRNRRDAESVSVKFARWFLNNNL